MKPFFFFLFSFLFTSAGAQTDIPLSNGLVANSTINSIVQSGNTIYLGGAFTAIGRNVANGAIVDLATGIPDYTMPKPNGVVHACIPDGVGGWYIGGQFTKVGTQTRTNLARINSDGSLHSWSPSTNNFVNALALRGNSVYIGGGFTQLNSTLRNYLGSVDTVGTLTSWNPGASAQIRAISATSTTIFVGGDFTTIGSGLSRVRLAALDSTSGVATSWIADADNSVIAIPLLSGKKIKV